MKFKSAFEAWAKPRVIDGRFANPVIGSDKSFKEFLKWRLTRKPGLWPKAMPEPVLKTFGPLREGVIELTFIGHSSFYLRTKDVGLLFDPVFADRISPVSFAGPKRLSALPFELESLPRVDCVCISHAHYDHLDLPTLQRLKKRYDPQFIVPTGNAKILEALSADRVVELGWWQSKEITSTLKVTMLPALHWSLRSGFDRNMALWASYAVELLGKKIFLPVTRALTRILKPWPIVLEDLIGACCPSALMSRDGL
jgi:hypothetical protein